MSNTLLILKQCFLNLIKKDKKFNKKKFFDFFFLQPNLDGFLNKFFDYLQQSNF